MSTIEYHKTIALNRKCLRFISAWPEPRNNYWAKIKFFTCIFSIVFFLLIPQGKKLTMVMKNLNEVIEILAIGLLTVFVTICKLLNLWFNEHGKH